MTDDEVLLLIAAHRLMQRELQKLSRIMTADQLEWSIVSLQKLLGQRSPQPGKRYKLVEVEKS